IDYLKMDVEGAERIVIAGGRDVLAHYRPLVQAELADGRTEAWGYHSREIALDLERHGYVMCEAEGLGIRRHNIQEGYQYTDLIGVPEERLSELKEAMTTS
ncbi:MAG: FkbM family methyltransferase, partial [Chloroflexi bacterium]|nr:FkbM family methyltransferase [Chloroflexota bacterium]